ncbi:uncharacterized protein [Triticum aestivum]|uniref:uncharacterized protein n=1 Tax=Triticum aestivum TaxID=4565 RepID=UPI001D00B9F6|nr:uncharacterized protein LOC123082335 [Triticum aestivum]
MALAPSNPVVVKCSTPTLQELEARALWSTKDPDACQVTAEEWICTNRAKHPSRHDVANAPTDNFLLWLPPLHYKECGKLNPTGYSWAMSGSKVNRQSLDCLVRNQGDHDGVGSPQSCCGQVFYSHAPGT